MTTSPRHSVSVAAVICNDQDEVLLIQRRDNGHWEPPGGVLELGEQIPAGLEREVFEETGARIEIGALTGVYKNMPAGIVALVFRCTLTSEPNPTSDEASQIAWHPLEQVPTLMDEAYAVRITDAAKPWAELGPAVRAHDGITVLNDDTDTKLTSRTNDPVSAAQLSTRDAVAPGTSVHASTRATHSRR